MVQNALSGKTRSAGFPALPAYVLQIDALKIYLAIVISFSKYPAPPNLSIMNNV
jgi:hypothetical protein